jgi:putative CocE/NonD family hydrolase
MQRPPKDPANPRGIDETTDAWDTVDWLVKNVPNNNGRAGMTGTSYDGWTSVLAAVDPHPALKAVIEQASPADMFLGDDFHHNGAFRLSYGFEYAALLETSTAENYHFRFDRADTYEWYLALGALSNANSRYFQGKIPTWQDFVQHPNYDNFWKRQTVINALDEVKVPIIHVAGWWDQEDFYGPQKIYEKLEKSDAKGWNYFVAGPWFHGQWDRDGSRLGPITFGSDTAKYYRENIFLPWFDYWLRGEGKLNLAEANTFETGANTWRKYDAWPPTKNIARRRLFMSAGRQLSFEQPTGKPKSDFDEYVSDPANPVPYRPRPINPTYPGQEWKEWLVQDQRFIDHRPDVLSWSTEPLQDDLRIAGNVLADLYASTSGTDSDWVVKLIDVYPEDTPRDAETKREMGGYQLMVANEIMRGRFREGFEQPKAIPSNQPLRYAIDLHIINHVFRKGHRVMVQVHSTWFPVYDRNPQKFVPNIFEAAETDYQKATQRIYRARDLSSAIVLPVVTEQ